MTGKIYYNQYDILHRKESVTLTESKLLQISLYLLEQLFPVDRD